MTFDAVNCPPGLYAILPLDTEISWKEEAHHLVNVQMKNRTNNSGKLKKQKFQASYL